MSAVNERPAAELTKQELIDELCSRPDFEGAIAFHSGPGPKDYNWKCRNCVPGLIFLQMANHLLTQPIQPPAAETQPNP